MPQCKLLDVKGELGEFDFENLMIDYGGNRQSVGKIKNGIIDTTVGVNSNIKTNGNRTLSPLDPYSGYDRIEKIMNLKVDGKYFFENKSSGVKTGKDNNSDGKIDNVVDMMAMNNYTLRVEPIIYFTPGVVENSVYDCANTIIYGSYTDVVKWAIDNKDKYPMEKSTFYEVLNALRYVVN